MSAAPAVSEWRSRILRTGMVNPAELVANPANWRQHPRHQQDAIRDLLGQVGWVQGVVVNERTGRLVDGHLRAELAVADKAVEIPAVWVDLSEDEERLVLAALDPIGALAVADPEALSNLLASLDAEGDGLRGLLDDLAGQFTPTDPYDPDNPGEAPGEEAFWPYLRMQVSNETLRAFEAWWPTVEGDSDDAKLHNLIGA